MKELNYEFVKLRDEIQGVTGVDMVTAGDSPLTFRILNKNNKYINLGLDRNSNGNAMIGPNNNSYEVSDAEVDDVIDRIKKHLKIENMK